MMAFGRGNYSNFVLGWRQRLKGKLILAPSALVLLILMAPGALHLHFHIKAAEPSRDLLMVGENSTNDRLHHSEQAATEPASAGLQPTIITASIYQGYGTHFINLHCGTPPQRQTLIIDTGSDVTGFVCQGCRHCGRQHNYFDPDQSNTFQELTCKDCLHGKCVKNLRNSPGHCRMEASYREGSGWKAKEATDVCHVGDWHVDRLQQHLQLSNLHDNITSITAAADKSLVVSAQGRFPLKFACQTSVSGAFQSQLEDGIVGLEYSSGSLWRQMYNSRAIQQRAFSLCFGRSLKPSTDGSALAGVLTLGGVDRRIHASPMVFAQGTEKASHSEYFYVTVRKVYLREGGGGNSVLSSDPKLKVHRINISETDLNEEEVIIDSGATDTYFTKRLEAPFQHVWEELTGERFDRRNEPKLTREELNNLPTMIFQLRGVHNYNRNLVTHDNETYPTGLAGALDPEHPYDVLVAVPPTYYYEYNPHTERYYSRFHFDPAYDSAFGSSSMMGHDIFFDIDHHRIGWAESTCDYKALVASTLEPDLTSRDVRSVASVPSAEHDTSKMEDSPTDEHNAHKEDGKISSVVMKGSALLLGQANTRPDAKPAILLCTSTTCYIVIFVLASLVIGSLFCCISKSAFGKRKRRRSDNFCQAVKASHSDSDDETEEGDARRTLHGSPRTRAFEDEDEPDSLSGGRGIFRFNSVTRRYRG